MTVTATVVMLNDHPIGVVKESCPAKFYNFIKAYMAGKNLKVKIPKYNALASMYAFDIDGQNYHFWKEIVPYQL